MFFQKNPVASAPTSSATPYRYGNTIAILFARPRKQIQWNQSSLMILLVPGLVPSRTCARRNKFGTRNKLEYE